MESIILEIRASEGGTDSKLIVEDMMNIYLKSARINNFSSTILEKRDGYASICLSGKKSKSYYSNEGGGHRWIRIPPTEKRGRTQTSIVTIAVIDPEKKFTFTLDKSKIKRKYIRSSKKGGQNVNKVSSCVQLTHISGIQVKCQDTRDQYKNEEIAWQRISDKLMEIEKGKFHSNFNKDLFNQIGNSSRSIKKRSYRVKEDLVIDHDTNKRCSFNDFLRGKIDLLS